MNTFSQNKLIVIVGATGVGKSEIALNLAEQTQASILSADSRQLYEGLIIGTASPSIAEQKKVKHYFVGNTPIEKYFNARLFEEEAISLLDRLFLDNSTQILAGGSMLYIDSVLKGIDDIPDVDLDIRKFLNRQFEEGKIDDLRMQLKLLDPIFYKDTDIKNPKRILHGLEICMTTGMPYSSFRKQKTKNRNFTAKIIGLERGREELYDRINQRVLHMIDLGLVDECKSLLPFRHLNALNTVGYKEIFAYLDGEYNLNKAIELIQRNTRHYAKKQITWFKKQSNVAWFHPNNLDEIKAYLG